MPHVPEPAESAGSGTNPANGSDTPASDPVPEGNATPPAQDASDVGEGLGAKGPVSPQTGGSATPRRWVQRAEGDRRTRARLRVIEGEGVIVLNDRRVPGSRSDIRRIAVSSAGVFVIDVKNYKGLVHIKRPGPVWDLGPHELYVGRRNCSSSVDSVARRMDMVRAALDTTARGAEVPVHAVLCLTRAEWGFASAIEISDVFVGWPKLVAGRVQAPGVMDSPAVQEVSAMIADHLPVA